MQFMIRAYDGPNMLDKRLAVRPRHLEGMKRLGRQIICAGGILDDEGKMKGQSWCWSSNPALPLMTISPSNLM